MILKDPKKNVIVMKGKIKQLQESLDPEEDMFTRPKSAEECVSLNSTESPVGKMDTQPQRTGCFQIINIFLLEKKEIIILNEIG